ncbi:MAG: hypothetical protein RM338_22665 [Nostoc sp. DedQUE12a]|nr:hypothetical protein [Nostoc sp. DedQUE12a]
MTINHAISSHNPSERRLLYIHIIMFLLAFILIISRRPDAILNPQFWAEDGTVFYAQAYNNGSLNSLFLPYAGYLHAVPRLTAAFSMLFPLKSAPLVFNLIAIIIQILPVNFLISSRFSKLIPNINYRIFISFLYLALPGCYEIHANITNAQWHIALLIFMALIAQSSRLLINLLDTILVFIGGLTGPFSIIITPAISFFILSDRFKEKRSYTFRSAKFLLLIITAIFQFIVIANDKTGQDRISGLNSNLLSLNTLDKISKILTNQLFFISFLGTKITDRLVKTLPEYLYNYLSVITVIIGASILFYLLLKSPFALKSFIIFSALIPSAVIASEFPDISEFLLVGFGGRYWFNFILSFSLGVLWLSHQIYKKRNHISKILVAIILLLMIVGISSDWQHPPFTDFEFAKYADKFAELPTGQKLLIPINPTLSMELIKH